MAGFVIVHTDAVNNSVVVVVGVAGVDVDGRGDVGIDVCDIVSVDMGEDVVVGTGDVGGTGGGDGVVVMVGVGASEGGGGGDVHVTVTVGSGMWIAVGIGVDVYGVGVIGTADGRGDGGVGC